MKQFMATVVTTNLLLFSGQGFAQNSENPIVNESVPITYYVLSDNNVIGSNQAPVVSFLTPVENQGFTVGDPLVIEVNASDSDGTVAKVDLRIGSEVVAVPSDYQAPYQWSSAEYAALNLPAGTHALSVTATDNFGRESVVTHSIIVEALNVAPTGSFVTPQANQRFTEGDSVAVEVDASDVDGGIASVELFVDGTALRTELNAPYNWNTAANPTEDGGVLNTLAARTSSYELKAVMTDSAGATTEVVRTIYVDAVVVDSDGDGVIDAEDAFPNDASETKDTDNDGVGDNADAFPNDPTRSEAESVTINLDFGLNGSPAGWNAITHVTNSLNLLDSNGDASEVLYTVSDTFDGIATINVRPSAEPYPFDVIKDAISSQGDNATASFTLSGLQPNQNYTIDFFTAHDTANDNRQAAYRVQGQTEQTIVANPSDRPTEPTSITLASNAAGELIVHVEKGVDNNNSIGKHYLAAMSIRSGSINSELPNSTEIANITSGVAPLAVSFDAGAEGDSFHNRLYEWNFGDINSGNWVGVESKTGLSKNVDTGPVNGHLYTKPGTYIATLRVSDAAGEIESLARQVTITVQDPNEIFAGEKTKCISIVGNFEGCPNGAERLTYDSQQLMANLYQIESESRVLFRRGDKWSNIGRVTGNQTIKDNIQFSAYGVCESPDERGICSNAPILENGSDRSIFNFGRHGTENITLEHLHITGTDRTTESISTATIPRNFILNKLKVTVADGFDPTEARGFAIVDSDLTGGHSAIVAIGGHNFIIKGNQLHNSYSAHLLRINSSYKSIIAHNVLHSVVVDPQRENSQSSQVLKFVGIDLNDSGMMTEGIINKFGTTSTVSQYNVISNNFFGIGGDWSISISPVNSRRNESISDVIFEKNFHSCAYGNPATRGTVIPEGERIRSGSCSRIMNIQAQDVTIRNNIFDLKKDVPDSTRVILLDMYSDTSPVPKNIKIYNNTFNADVDISGRGQAISHSIVRVVEQAEDIEVINNLVRTTDITKLGSMIDPRRKEIINNNQVYTLIPLDISKIYVNNNLITETPRFVDISTPDTLQRDYRLQDSSLAIGAGVSLPEVIDDFAGSLRSSSATSDIGAFIKQ